MTLDRYRYSVYFIKPFSPVDISLYSNYVVCLHDPFKDLYVILVPVQCLTVFQQYARFMIPFIHYSLCST